MQLKKLIGKHLQPWIFRLKNEHILAQKLRKSDSFIHELSLVAEIDNRIVDHILFLRGPILGVESYESLAMAPVVVLSDYQNRFGFIKSSSWGVIFAGEVPDEVMAVELIHNFSQGK